MYNKAKLEGIKPTVCCFFYMTQKIFFSTSGNSCAKHLEP